MSLQAVFRRGWPWPAIVFILLSLSLSGCGGGSDSSSEAEAASGTGVALAGLTLAGVELDQTFQTERTLYTASVDAARDTITLTAVADASDATIRVDGAEVDPDSGSVTITLAEGSNLIEILVTAADDSVSATYTLAVFRAGEGATGSSQARLSGLSLNGADLDQTFQADRTIYTASVDATQETITLTPVAADEDDTILVDGSEVATGSASAAIDLAEGSNLIEIQVASQDGGASTTYTLAVFRGDTATEGAQALLSGLSLSWIRLDETFQPDRLNYTASTSYSRSTTTLTPVAADEGAGIRVNGVEVASGSASSSIALAVGQNLIEIEVTTADGSATTTYTVAVHRSDGTSASSDASLSGLTLSGSATLDQTFQPSQTAYSASVGYFQNNVTLTPVASHAGASILINGEAVASGSASSSIALAEGQNLISLTVTAQDGVTTQDYSVTLLREYAALFAQQAYLKASNAEVYDNFGYNVALSGDTLVVGAAGEDSSASGGEGDNSASVAGAAYVFTRSGGVWSQQAYLKASNAEASDIFGGSVSISGDTLVVGAPYEASSASGGEGDNSAPNAGAAYVFTRSGGVWSQQAYLKASNAEGGDQFGESVSISGNTLVVGAYREASSASGGEGDNSATYAGAAYVFTRNGGAWSQQAYLKASNAEAYDQFGTSVSISGDTLVVGAYTEDSSASGGEGDNSASYAGAAYVFTRNGGVWSQQAYLKASNAEGGDLFGRSVSISGDTLVVGAYYEDSSASGGEGDNSAPDAGAAYVWQ